MTTYQKSFVQHLVDWYRRMVHAFLTPYQGPIVSVVAPSSYVRGVHYASRTWLRAGARHLRSIHNTGIPRGQAIQRIENRNIGRLASRLMGRMCR